MHQRGKTVTRSDGGTPGGPNRQQHLHPDCPRFNEWIDPSSDGTDTDVSHLVIDRASGRSDKNHQKRCCRTSTSSGYSSHSPPPSGGSCYAACCPNTGISKGSFQRPPQHHPHHHHHPSSRISVGGSNHQSTGSSSLAVIHETEAIPRPIWPFMADDYTEANVPAYAEMTDGAGRAATRQTDETTNRKIGCDHCRTCRTSSNASRRDSSLNGNSASSAREVLLELSRTLNSVIEADGDLSAEEILRDISLTVARGIDDNQPEEDPTSDPICDEYIYRLSSSSSSGGGMESSVGVNPVNLRVYGKPKWLHVPASSRSSSQCPYEGKTLLNSAQNASRTQPALPNPNRKKINIETVAPAVFLLPQRNFCYPNSCRNNDHPKITDRNGRQDGNPDSGHFDNSANRNNAPIGRLNNPRGNDNSNDKCNSGEPVYSTLDGSDESSSYGAIGDSQTASKSGWNNSAKAFDRHLDFTLDGSRAERLGRAIAKAKRRRQWCRGITAMLGLVFFILSVVVVSLSVTRGRKVFGSM